MIIKLIKIFFFSLAIFSFNVISAEAAISCSVKSSCSSGEVNVLELSGTTNAHAALPGSGYPYAICCSGATGLSASCSQNKVFAKLSGSQNAHVRLNTESDYPGSNNACLSVSAGTLTLGNQDNNCNGFDTTILSLAKIPTNSHVGEGSAYPHKICAKYKAPSSSGGWLSDFFGFLRGGGGSSNNDNSETTVIPIVINNQPAPTTPISPVPLKPLTRTNTSTIENDSVSLPDQIAVNDQNNEEVLIDSGDIQTPPNLQAAAANQGKSGLSSLLTSTLFKIISIFVVLVLIILGRKLYLKRK